MDFKQNDAGDLVLENNNLVSVNGANEVRQRVLQNLRTFMGEWFLDYSLGVPYFQDVFTKAVDRDAVSTVLQASILGSLGVLELLAFSLDFTPSTRSLGCDFTFRAYDGDIVKIQEALSV